MATMRLPSGNGMLGRMTWVTSSNVAAPTQIANAIASPPMSVRPG
jgi:hypothetical protein